MTSKKTFGVILSEGLVRAGRTDLTTSAGKALNSKLRSLYKDWLWPFLRGSVERLSLPAGTTSLKFGGGESSVNKEILRLLNPIWLSDAAYNSPSMCTIINLDQTQLINENRVNSPTLVRGIPRNFKVRETLSSLGVMCKEIIPIPIPDKQYYISFDCTILPEDCGSSDIPLYPNDETLILFVEWFARKYGNSGEAADVQALKQEFEAEARKDRVKDGLQVGTNDCVTMDPSIYR